MRSTPPALKVVDFAAYGRGSCYQHVPAPYLNSCTVQSDMLLVGILTAMGDQATRLPWCWE